MFSRRTPEDLQQYNDGFLHDPLFKVNVRAKRILFRFDHKIRRTIIIFPRISYVRKAAQYRDAFNTWIATIDKPSKKILKEGEIILYKGTHHHIFFTHEPLYIKARVDAIIDEGDYKLRVNGRKEEQLTMAVKDFLNAQALTYATILSDHYAQALGVTLGQITIRDLKSMWGRCMRQRDLCYNWRLILAPSHIFDYVCAHEVSHCVHPNHSRDFWKTVAQICPHFKQSRQWLKQHSGELFRYCF